MSESQLRRDERENDSESFSPNFQSQKTRAQTSEELSYCNGDHKSAWSQIKAGLARRIIAILRTRVIFLSGWEY